MQLCELIVALFVQSFNAKGKIKMITSSKCLMIAFLIFGIVISTTTMASSTTMPIANINPNTVRLFREKPNVCMTVKVPISETGIASTGITAARQDWRNTLFSQTLNCLIVLQKTELLKKYSS